MLNIFAKITTAAKVIGLFRDWPNVFLGYSRLRRNKLYTLHNGIKYAVASNIDWVTISEIWADRIYNPSGQEIESGYTVVDIGAHVGIFSVFAARQSADVRVISYEPHPYNFQLLTENIHLNNLTNIDPLPLAVHVRSGKGKLFASREDFSHSLVKTAGSYIEVDCVTLKEVLDRIGKCDFLKMDCEGAEYDILFNTSIECLSKVNKISVECHDTLGYAHSDYDAYDLKIYLEQLGFRVEIAGKAGKSPIYLYGRRMSRCWPVCIPERLAFG